MRVLCCVLFLFCSATVAADAPSLQRFEFSQPHMGTLYRIVLFAPDEHAASDGARAAFDTIGKLDTMLTDYDDSSELMQLCQRAGSGPVAVSPELFEVLDKALEAGRRTHGAFDITVGPVVTLWRRARRKKELPDPAELAAAVKLMGLDSVVLNRADRTVDLKKKGMRLDLGGIAKGYAVDKALKVLREKGLSRALVIGGGDTGVSDPPPGKEGWSVEVKTLEAGVLPTAVSAPQLITLDCEEATITVGELLRAAEKNVLLLHNCGVSTSGDEAQHLELNGVRYSHVIDPATGKALEGRRSVTVVAPDTTTSDALAKVCALPPEQAVQAVEAIPNTALFYAIEKEGRVHAIESKSWMSIPRAK